MVQQQTSDLHFCQMPAILLQQENSQKKEKEKKEKGDESQRFEFHDDTDNSANLEKILHKIGIYRESVISGECE